MVIIHSGVKDTVSHSGDALYAIKLSVEVSAVRRSKWTKNCPIISVCDLLVIFH